MRTPFCLLLVACGGTGDLKAARDSGTPAGSSATASSTPTSTTPTTSPTTRVTTPPTTTVTTTSPTTTSTTPTTTPTTTTTTTTSGLEWVRVDEGLPDVYVEGPNLAGDGAGRWVVSWVDNRRGFPQSALRMSRDALGTWEPSVVVETAGQPIVASWAKPSLSIGGGRIGLVSVYTMGDAMFGAGQDASLADLAFTPPLVPGVGLVEMITGAMSPAGELWMSWTAYPAAGHTAARMGNPILGWAGVPVGAFLDGQPCECCPMDFRFDPTGAPLTAWRHNVDNVRNMAVAKGEAGAHTMPLASIATSTDWFIMACPTQGPRLSFRDDASTWIAWSDMSSGEGRAYVAPSRDGLSYDAEIMVAPDLDALQQSPVLAHGPSGMMYLAFQTEHWGGAMLTTSADGVSWSAPMTLTSPEGHLGSIEIERAGDQVVLVGATDVAEGGSVWLAVLE